MKWLTDRLIALWRLVLVIVPAMLLLGVLNALPQFLGGEPLGVVRYATVEDLEARVGATLYRPALPAASWHWPPARVRLAVGTSTWAEFAFDAAPGADAGELIVCQTVGGAPRDAEVPVPLLSPGEFLQGNHLAFPDAGPLSASGPVWMQRVLLGDGQIVHEIWWSAGSRRVMLRSRLAADKLPAIAQTVLRKR